MCEMFKKNSVRINESECGKSAHKSCPTASALPTRMLMGFYNFFATKIKFVVIFYDYFI